MIKNKYIFLTLLCLAGIILINTTGTPVPSLVEKTKVSLERGKISLSRPSLPAGFLAVFYLGLLAAGIGNLILFAARRKRKKASADLYSPFKKFPLSRERTTKLIFLIVFFILSVSAGERFLALRKLIGPRNLAVFFNLLLEISVAVVILRFLPLRSLGLKMDKPAFNFLFKLYTAVLPFVLASLLLNGFLLEKIGVKPALNPAAELFFLLKDKGFILILSLEIILLGPVAEELFFRGFAYRLLRQKLSFRSSALLISLLFSLMHRTPLNILPLFIISFALCYLYEKTQSIVSPIIFHLIHNSLNLSIILAMKNLL